MKKSVICALLSVLCAGAAHAVCPVCTIAVGAGLEGARLLGVDDVITGIWAGALTLSVFFWTAGWLKKKGVENIWLQIVAPFVLYYGLLAGVYLMPSVNFGANALWGIDKFLLGIVSGSIVFFLSERWNAQIKQKNGGKVLFPFQKVIIPLCALLALSGVFIAIVYL
ncbi:MAG: hypothetical protein LBJ73_04060 [Rickettsiales bacterium]|jgi:hypothetical protein|nr:hypothetical protein [Rickettsiales bacterium]